MSNFVKIRLLFGFCLLACGSFPVVSTVSASTALTRNQSPAEQILRVGQLFSLTIGSPDELSGVTSLSINQLPADAVVLKNRSGTFTLMWVPQIEDIGEFELDIFSRPDNELYGTLRLQVANAQQYEQLRQQALFKATSPVAIPAAQENTTVENTSDSGLLETEVAATPEVVEAEVVEAEVVEAEVVEAEVVEAEVVEAEVVEAEVVEAEVVEAEVVETKVVEAESLASINPADSMDVQPLTAPVATPSLVVETNLLLPAGEKATIPVTVLASQESTQVRALNLPKGARLIHRGTKINTDADGSNRTDRYALMWMPPSDRSVIHVVIVQLLADGRVITSRRVQLVTVL